MKAKQSKASKSKANAFCKKQNNLPCRILQGFCMAAAAAAAKGNICLAYFQINKGAYLRKCLKGYLSYAPII